MSKIVASLLFASAVLFAAWSFGWLSSSSAQSLNAAPAALPERPEIPAFRGNSGASPNVSDLPLDNVAVVAQGASEAHAIPPTWLPRTVANASVWARPLLADGVVTLDERNTALLAAHRCTVDGSAHLSGVVDKGLTGFPGPFATFAGATAPTHEILLQLSALHQACVVEYWRDVASAWSSADAYARMAPLWGAITVCMRKAGASLPDGAEWETLYAESLRFSGSRALIDSCSPH